MENLMILPAVEPKRFSWLNEVRNRRGSYYRASAKREKTLPFIEANTKAVELSHLKNECIVPVFSKDNELTISHPAFIETVAEAVSTFYNGEKIETPEIRVSHIIKGRIPEAIHKPANQLLESDKTIYYERMMFCIEVPTIYETVEGNKLTLTVGGVRAYNHMNLYPKSQWSDSKSLWASKISCVATSVFHLTDSLSSWKFQTLLTSTSALWKCSTATTLPNICT